MNTSPPPRRIALGLGSSLGDRRATLELALQRLAHAPGLHLERASRWVRTPPMRGGSATGWFLNGVAVFRTALDPRQVLQICRDLEEASGRRRSRHWGDRTLDLDVLLVDGVVLDDPALQLPHPGLAHRAFALLPLLEIWPDARDPATGLPYATMPSPTGPRAVPVGVVARAPRTVTPIGPPASGAP